MTRQGNEIVQVKSIFLPIFSLLKVLGQPQLLYEITVYSVLVRVDNYTTGDI